MFINYTSKKNNGLTTVSRINDAYALSIKNFDAETGSEMEPTVFSVDMEELAVKKAALESQIADIDQLIIDCEALDE